jgi:carboxyl-terminal processing protease
MSSRSQPSPPLEGTLRSMLRSPIVALLLLSVAAALFSAGFLLGDFGIPDRAYATAGTPAELARQFHIFWEAWQRVEQEFFSPAPLDPQAMTYGAIRGMMTALGDPFTYFVEPSRYRLESDTANGAFGGIGASLALVGARATFTETYVGSPAEVAGLQAGDRLLGVNGADVTGLPLDQVVLLIRGPLDTSVRLDVQREGGQKLSLDVVRQRIDLPSLSSLLVSDEVGYIGIQTFTARTGEELAGAIQDLQGQNAKALVLDVRGNGVGLTDGAIDVLRCLLGHGIAFREVLPGAEERRYAIPFAEPLVDWPLAVLLDGGTASAAEMVAAAIRDYQRGVLIGQRTFGKGSVQSVHQLSDGSSVHVTVSRWLSADGYPIEGVGLEPDIVVAAATSPNAGDPPLWRAVQYLDQKIGRVPSSEVAPLRLHDTGKVTV